MRKEGKEVKLAMKELKELRRRRKFMRGVMKSVVRLSISGGLGSSGLSHSFYYNLK